MPRVNHEFPMFPISPQLSPKVGFIFASTSMRARKKRKFSSDGKEYFKSAGSGNTGTLVFVIVLL